MNLFLNNMPELNQFTKQAKNKYYVDKTGLIDKLNTIMDEYQIQFVCITRPRRFGKTVNAMMLANYYSKHLDTRSISQSEMTPTSKPQGVSGGKQINLSGSSSSD